MKVKNGVFSFRMRLILNCTLIMLLLFGLPLTALSMNTVGTGEPGLKFYANTIDLNSSNNCVSVKLPSYGGDFQWQYGFLPAGGTNGTGYDNIRIGGSLNSWQTFKSDNLMGLTPKPAYITALEVGGNGWNFAGKADDVYLGPSSTFSPKFNHIKRYSFSSFGSSWTDSSAMTQGSYTATLDTTDGVPAPSLSYARTGSGNVGGWVGMQQNLRVGVKSWSNLYVGYKYKIISNTLASSGWALAAWGETPARIVMHYQAAVTPDSVHVTGIDTDNDGAIDIFVNLDVQCSQSLSGGLICKLDSQALVEQLKSANLQLPAKITLVISGNYGGDLNSTFTRSGILYVIDCSPPESNPC